MKKLMVMLSAVAMSFGVFAAADGTEGGISFEQLNAGSVSATDITDDSATWAFTGDAKADVVAEASTCEGGRPAEFKTAGQAKVLKVATPLGDRVTRTLSTPLAAATTGLYLDTLVKFTAFEEAPTAEQLGSDGKIAVWLLEDEDSGETTLNVSAGSMDAQGNITADTYECSCSVTPKADEWHRLTIKVLPAIISGSTKSGFVLFVDGEKVFATKAAVAAGAPVTDEAAVYAKNNQLFPTLVSGDVNLNAVALSGQGSIDDISCTTTAPDFASNLDLVTITWTKTGAIASMTINGNPVDTFADGKAVFVRPAGDMKIVWVGANGYMDGEKTLTAGDTNVSIDNDIKTPVAEFAGKQYGDLAEAVADANGAEEPGTLKLLANLDAAMAFVNSKAVITINLDGKKAQAISAGLQTHIVIDDSSDGANGSVEGAITATGMGNGIVINAGKVLVATNADLDKNVKVSAKDGYEFVKVGAYWELQEKPATFTVTVAEAATHSSVSVLSNGTETLEFATSYTLPDDGSFLKVTYTADTEAGYQFVPNQDTEFTLDSNGDAATAPVVEAIEYAITYMYDGKPLTDLVPTSYNVEDTLDLPTSVSILDVKFEGWYNDEELTDGPVTQIVAGTKGEKTFYAKATPLGNPLDDEIAETVDESELDEGQKTAVRENMMKLNNACGGIDEGKAWIAKVYGETKIDGAKLAATTEDLIATSVAFDLPVMSGVVEVAVAAAEEGAGFTFAITDGDGAVSVAKAKLQQMVKYTAALDEAFDDSTGKVAFDENPDETFTARFVEGPAAGFMKVDLTVDKE